MRTHIHKWKLCDMMDVWTNPTVGTISLHTFIYLIYTLHIYQITMLYTLNLHKVACHLYLNEARWGRVIKRHFSWAFGYNDRRIDNFMFLMCFSIIHTHGNLFMLHYLIIRMCFWAGLHFWLPLELLCNYPACSKLDCHTCSMRSSVQSLFWLIVIHLLASSRNLRVILKIILCPTPD